jgi:hypothetical protein
MTLPLPSHPLAVDTDVADYAVGLAYAVHLKGEAAALKVLELDPSAWERAAAWPLRLTDQVDRGEMSDLTTFGRVFKETQDLLRAASAPVEPPVAAPKSSAPALSAGLIGRLSNEAAAQPAPPLEVPAAPSIATPSTRRDRVAPAPARVVDLDTTAEAFGGSRPPATLPFQEARGASVSSATPAPAAAPPKPARLDAPAAGDGAIDLDKTLEGPVLPLRSPLPFASAREAQAPAPRELTLEQYASLCVSLDTFPEKEAFILQRYGIDQPHELEQVHKKWQSLFASDAAARASWHKHVEEIRARLRDAK